MGEQPRSMTAVSTFSRGYDDIRDARFARVSRIEMPGFHEFARVQSEILSFEERARMQQSTSEAFECRLEDVDSEPSPQAEPTKILRNKWSKMNYSILVLVYIRKSRLRYQRERVLQ